MTDYNTELEDLGDNYERMRKDCPGCGSEGTVIEPRSSDLWNCSQCARQFEYDELAWQ